MEDPLHRFNRLLNDLELLLHEERFALENQKLEHLKHVAHKKGVIFVGLAKQLPLKHPYYVEKLGYLLARDSENKQRTQALLNEHKTTLEALDAEAQGWHKQKNVLRTYSQNS